MCSRNKKKKKKKDSMTCVMSKGMSVNDKMQNTVRVVKQTFSQDTVRCVGLVLSA